MDSGKSGQLISRVEARGAPSGAGPSASRPHPVTWVQSVNQPSRPTPATEARQPWRALEPRGAKCTSFHSQHSPGLAGARPRRLRLVLRTLWAERHATTGMRKFNPDASTNLTSSRRRRRHHLTILPSLTRPSLSSFSLSLSLPSPTSSLICRPTSSHLAFLPITPLSCLPLCILDSRF